MDKSEAKAELRWGCDIVRVAGPFTYARAKNYLARWARASDCVLFRGHTRASWGLESSIVREGWFRSLKLGERNRVQEDLWKLFEETCKIRGVAGASELSGERGWQLAQHHGLPTRLLDWTFSPYVALFFAFDGSGSKLLSEDVAVWCLDFARFREGAIAWQRNEEGDETGGDDDAVWERYQQGLDAISLVRYVSGENIRQNRQMGAFTQSHREVNRLEDYIEAKRRWFGPRTLRKLVIRESEHEKALRDLELMGLDAAYLLGDIGGASRLVYNRFFRFRVPATGS